MTTTEIMTARCNGLLTDSQVIIELMIGGKTQEEAEALLVQHKRLTAEDNIEGEEEE